LKNEYPAADFITYFRRSLTSDVLVSLGGGENDSGPPGCDCLEIFKPHFVILQMGIVDCAPRLFSALTRKIILARLPNWLRSVTIKIAKKTRSRRAGRTDVPPERYKKNLDTYFKRCEISAVEKVIIIKICYPDARMRKKNPGIVGSLKLYNQLIDEVAQKYASVHVVDPLDTRQSTEQIFDEDGYHPNGMGHERVYQAVSAVLSKR